MEKFIDQIAEFIKLREYDLESVTSMRSWSLTDSIDLNQMVYACIYQAKHDNVVLS